MAWQQSDLDAINEAIASGAREVQYSDRKVVYNSLGDLVRAKGIIAAELSGKKRVSRRYGVFFKN